MLHGWSASARRKPARRRSTRIHHNKSSVPLLQFAAPPSTRPTPSSEQRLFSEGGSLHPCSTTGRETEDGDKTPTPHRTCAAWAHRPAHRLQPVRHVRGALPDRSDRRGRPAAWLQGNRHDAALGASLCAKGSAGLPFEHDDERPQTPLIRMGPRGGGQWRRASWDEALDYVADKLRETVGALGPRGIALSDRGGFFTDLTRTFLAALGSPNYFNHDATCGGNVHNAARTLFGFGHLALVPDLARHQAPRAVRPQPGRIADGQGGQGLHGRGRQRHARHLCRSARQPTACKATRYWQVRPNSDYALNLAIIHEVLKRARTTRTSSRASSPGWTSCASGRGHHAGMAGTPHRRDRRRAARLRRGNRGPGVRA